MKGLLRNLLFITVPVILILIVFLEIFFRYVIPASSPPRGYYDEEEMIHRYDPSRENGIVTIGRLAEIRIKWHINNWGWNYPIDYHLGKQRLIAVIGDSYVEGLHVDTGKNYPFLLREKLFPDYEVFAFGRSIYPLSQYLHVSRYVKRHFNPDILIFNVVYNDFDESIYELCHKNQIFMQVSMSESADLSERLPEPGNTSARHSPAKAFFRDNSAFIRYLVYNLQARHIIRNFGKKRPHDKERYEENIDYKRVMQNRDLIEKATDYIIGTIMEENRDKRVIFLMDAPRKSIYESALSKSNVIWINKMMGDICAGYDAEYIDLTCHMARDYEKNGIKFNSEIDWHYNEYGHQFVAGVLYGYLTGHLTE